LIVLTIKTDNPEAEVALFDDLKQVDKIKWQANRILADTIHIKIKDLLTNSKLKWQDINGMVCYKGPGSFTGLRIGLSVANALAYGLDIPVVSNSSKNWQRMGIEALLGGKNDKITLPEYGSEAKITKPKK
jgi:tRNA threonylcarbamoyladenosine biosynthesis protein TsaB